MNDIVFAGKNKEAFACGEKYSKCLKVLVAEDGVKICGAGAMPVGEGLLVCIEQPLLPPCRAFSFNGDVKGLAHAAEQAERYYIQNPDGAVLAALGGLIVSYIAERHSSDPQPVVKLLKQDLDSRFADPTFSVEAAIRKLPLNYDYVRKLFKKEMGLTPHDYLTELRMKRAKDLILSGVTNRYSQFSVSQIAEACGFSEPLYFSRVFKKYYGVSPANYNK